MAENSSNLNDAAIKNFLEEDSHVIPELEIPEGEQNTPTQNQVNVTEELPSGEDVAKPNEMPTVVTEDNNISSANSNQTESTEEDVETETVAFKVYNTLQESLGIEFTDEELSQVPLNEGVEAISKLTSIGIEKKSNEMFNSFFEENPDIYEAVQYKRANGSLKGFGEQTLNFVDYDSMDISSESVQESLYRKALEAKGLSPEDINDLVETAKDKFTLDTKAEAARKELSSLEKSKKAEYENSLKSKIEAEENERLAIIKEATSIIDSGKVLGLQLDSKTKAQFKEYFSKPVDNKGRTAKEIADESLTLEQELYLEYLKMTGFKSGNLTQSKAIKTLADLVKNSQANRAGVVTEKGSVPKGTNMGSQGNVDFDALAEFVQS